MTILTVIPPLAMADSYRAGTIFLFLPQLMKNTGYANYVRELSDNIANFTILDNGAYEGSLDTALFIEAMRDIDPDEVVIPDVLGDAKMSLTLAADFFSYRHHLPGLRYMLVAQGKTVNEIWDMLLVAIARHPSITTIGLPKHLVTTVDTHARVVLTNRIKEMYQDRFDIHFLGSSPALPNEIMYVSNMVRSMDTSMPFAFAWHGLNIGHPDVEHGGRTDAERPTDYFNRPAQEFDIALVNKNIETMKSWCASADL